jgi:mannose-1-phosphate guanylyltransferase
MYGVILAGGGGTRLWPQSRTHLPKPLMPLLPDGSTMLQATFARLRPLIPPSHLFVSTGAVYADQVWQQLPELPADHLIIEPSGRDTAPAVGLAATHVARLDPAAVMGVFPADHIIRDEDGFRANLVLANQVAEQGYLVTLGMRPSHPETGYGYVEVAGPVPGVGADGRALEVARFVEKPNLATATAYLAGGRHLWNAGIFIWRVDVILDQFRTLAPDMAARLAAIDAAVGTPDAQAVLEREWEGMRKISVDFAIMEKAPRVATIPSDIGWSDAGDWHAIGTLLGQPEAGFVGAGVEHLGFNSRDCVVVAPPGKLVATVGLEDLVIVDTPDALLICPRSRAQEVRRIVDALRERGRTDLL